MYCSWGNVSHICSQYIPFPIQLDPFDAQSFPLSNLCALLANNALDP